MNADANRSEMSPANLLLSLPPDLRIIILSDYLGPEEISRLRSCSQTLRETCEDERIWKKFCCREVGIDYKLMGPVYRLLGIVSRHQTSTI